MSRLGTDRFTLQPYLLEYPVTSVPGGMVMPYAWPGGYTILYMFADGDAICGHCLNTAGNLHFRREIVRVMTADWLDGQPFQCVQCQREFSDI